MTLALPGLQPKIDLDLSEFRTVEDATDWKEKFVGVVEYVEEQLDKIIPKLTDDKQ